MVDPIFDDVKELMEKEKGDQRILEQIRRAAENDEVISVYERDYVRKLADRYLEKKVPETKEPTNDVKLPETNVAQNVTQTTHAAQVHQTPRQVSQKKSSKKSVIVIGAAVLAAILIVGVGVSGVVELPETPSSSDQPTVTSSGIVLDTDVSSYSKGDIVSISGSSDPSLGQTIDLSIENAEGNVIWEEDLRVKSDGSYSTLTIAGGSGWQNSGTYSLNAEHGSEEASITFRYLG